MTFWTPDIAANGVARYIALADEIETAIQSGELSAGDKLPTHRKMADLLDVTVGTVTRGYSEAERRGLVSAIVGSGTFVSSQKLPDIQFAHLSPSASNEIDLSLNLPIANQSAPGIRSVLQEISGEQELFVELMGYQHERGLKRHRLWAAGWLAEQGIRCNSDNLAITCGGQHAITLSLMAATRAGDTIAAEGLAYPGLKTVANQLGLKVIGLPMDEQGVLPDAFASYCRLNHLRAIYLCPSIQNPTNASMGLERRKAIVKIAQANDVWIIEDEIPTNYLSQNLNSFANLAPEQTFYINSHSKTVAPGLRVGYLISPARVIDSISASIRAQCWFAPTINVEIAQRWLDKKEAKDWLNVQKKDLFKRQALTSEILDGYEFELAKGSFHAWLSLPEPWRALEFQSMLADKGVRVLSAEAFAVGRFPAPQAIRICISGPALIKQLETGLKIIRQQLDDGYDTRLSVF